MIIYNNSIPWKYECATCDNILSKEDIVYCGICNKMLCKVCDRKGGISINNNIYCYDCHIVGRKYIKEMLELEKSFENNKRKWMVDRLLKIDLNTLKNIKFRNRHMCFVSFSIIKNNSTIRSKYNCIKWNDDKTKLLINTKDNNYEVPLSSVIAFDINPMNGYNF